MEGKAVTWYSDVFESVFPNLDRERANSMWKDQLKAPDKTDGEGKTDG
jgi:Lon-like ATP-dependent protease